MLNWTATTIEQRHTAAAQRAAFLWKQVLLTLLVLVALLALLGGALWQKYLL